MPTLSSSQSYNFVRYSKVGRA